MEQKSMLKYIKAVRTDFLNQEGNEEKDKVFLDVMKQMVYKKDDTEHNYIHFLNNLRGRELQIIYNSFKELEKNAVKKYGSKIWVFAVFTSDRHNSILDNGNIICLEYKKPEIDCYCFRSILDPKIGCLSIGGNEFTLL